jgi:hypothetical protein
MRFAKWIAFAGCVLILGAGAAGAGINSKEVGALLVYPEYWATDQNEPGGDGTSMLTYVSITNDFSQEVSAHIEIVGGVACDDCNFDLYLTGFQTKRLLLRRQQVAPGVWATVVYDASVHSTQGSPAILAACPERHGFIIASLEAARFGAVLEPRVTLGANVLHGDEVVVDILNGSASQVGAISVQGAGPNNGDRWFDFNNQEYLAFPSIVTTNFWSVNDRVDPRLILLNVDFSTNRGPGDPAPSTSCSLNYVNAEERVFSRNFAFGCWSDSRLIDISPNFHENVLGTANGFLWVQCDAGTHGALLTRLAGSTANYPYPPQADFKDTLFQSVTTNPSARLCLTPSITGGPPAP